MIALKVQLQDCKYVLYKTKWYVFQRNKKTFTTMLIGYYLLGTFFPLMECR